MITFRVLIQRVACYRPFRLQTKWIEIALPVFQHSKVEEKFPGWEVSMFWPK